MRILFLTHRVPYPPDKGDRIRSYNVIKFLARNHSIALMSVSHEPVPPKSWEALKEYCDSVEIVGINAKLSTLWSGLHLFTKSPLTLPAFYSRRFHQAVRAKLEKTAFDLIYIYSSSMAQYVLDAEPIPKVMDFIDVDSQKWFDYAARARQPMKAIYHREGIRLRAFEKQVASRCELNLFTTESELKIFKDFAPDSPAIALPNGVDSPPTPKQSYRPNKLVFVGSMDYLPNIDAMLYFTGEILPLIQKEIPDVELFIVGRNPSSQVKALGRLENVTVTGDVNEVGSYLQDAAASVIPLRIARGMQTKILEAMAHGVPVITTRAALDGITAEPGRDVLTADDPQSFAQKTVAVLQNRNMRTQLAANALALVQKAHRWETTLQKLEDCIPSISRNSNSKKPQAVQNLRDLRAPRGEKISFHIPFVSFVIPAKNEEQMIGQCLDAINNLAYDPASRECIVVDNGSVDDTAKIAKQKGAKVLTMLEGTISALRNFGANQAQGEYFAFIDADCAIETNWLKNALPHLEDPTVGCAGSHPGIPKESTWVQKAWHLQNTRTATAEEVDWLPSMNMLVTKQAFTDCGGFNESLITCEDVDFCYRLKRKYKIVSDGNIKSVHFGEAKTVSEFFRKERWRGQSSLPGLLSHGFYWQEVPSLLLPIYYLIAIIFFPVTLVYLVDGSIVPVLINVMAVLLPSLLLALRTSVRVSDFTGFVQLTFLYLVYSLGRVAGMVSVKPPERPRESSGDRQGRSISKDARSRSAH